MRSEGRVRSTGLWGLLLLAACLRDDPPAATRGPVAVPPPTYPTQIVLPRTLSGIATGARDLQGDRVVIRCATCHAMMTAPPALPATAAAAAGPHVGLRLDHGNLRCAACHDPTDYTSLRLADGDTLALIDAGAICGQCHGPQARDYAHGAHGGMRGYWDLSRGPRQRTACVGCHDPHEPAYPQYLPAPPPRDRFASLPGGTHE